MDGSCWNIIGNTLVASVSIFVGEAPQNFHIQAYVQKINSNLYAQILGEFFSTH
jgi:hypothetical protein